MAYRNTLCPCYDKCLTHYAKQNVSGFDCAVCIHRDKTLRLELQVWGAEEPTYPAPPPRRREIIALDRRLTDPDGTRKFFMKDKKKVRSAPPGRKQKRGVK